MFGWRKNDGQDVQPTSQADGDREAPMELLRALAQVLACLEAHEAAAPATAPEEGRSGSDPNP